MSCCSCWKLIFGKSRISTAQVKLNDSGLDDELTNDEDDFNWARFENYLSHFKLQLLTDDDKDLSQQGFDGIPVDEEHGVRSKGDGEEIAKRTAARTAGNSDQTQRRTEAPQTVALEA